MLNTHTAKQKRMYLHIPVYIGYYFIHGILTSAQILCEGKANIFKSIFCILYFCFYKDIQCLYFCFDVILFSFGQSFLYPFIWPLTKYKQKIEMLKKFVIRQAKYVYSKQPTGVSISVTTADCGG